MTGGYDNVPVVIPPRDFAGIYGGSIEMTLTKEPKDGFWDIMLGNWKGCYNAKNTMTLKQFKKYLRKSK